MDQLIIVPDSGNVVYAYSFWGSGEDAGKYDHTTLPMLNKVLSGVVEGGAECPRVWGIAWEIAE